MFCLFRLGLCVPVEGAGVSLVLTGYPGALTSRTRTGYDITYVQQYKYYDNDRSFNVLTSRILISSGGRRMPVALSA